jgi:peptidoglycan/LPS O-acetylase OafA/YrhL/lysophospholipase L1-like esterase
VDVMRDQVKGDLAEAPARRLLALDGLRAVAIAAVVVYHLNPHWLPGGNLGVDVFFVISGYLITSTLLTRWMPKGISGVPRFWLGRMRRLFPALFAMVTLVTALLIVFPPDLRVRLGRQLFGGLTYTSNWLAIAVHGSYFDQTAPQVFAHLWSLAVEEQFYLVWPLVLLAVLRWMRSRRWRVVFAVAVAGLSALGMALGYVPGADPSPIYLATHTHAFGLMLGAAAAFWRPLGESRRLPLSARALQAVSVGSGLAVVAGFWALPADAGRTYLGGMLVLCAVTAVLVLTLADDRGWGGRVLSLRPLVWVGERSYSLYLWHWPLIILGAFLFGRLGVLGTVLQVVVAVGASVVLAAASYRWIERPVVARGFRASLARIRAGLRPRRRLRLTLTAAAAIVTGLLVASVLTAPARTSAERYIAAGRQYVRVTPGGGAAAASPRSPAASADPAAPVTPITVGGQQLLAVGDSVMLAAAPALSAAFPGIVVDAQVGRQGPQTLDAARAWLRQSRARRVLIVHVGTNGTISTAQLTEFLDEVGTSRRVVLVNVHAARSWTAGDNQAIRAAAAGRRNVAVADWDGRIGGQPQQLAADGIHPNQSGQATYVAVVRAALQQVRVAVAP